MKITEHLSILGVVAFAVGALASLTAPIASLTPAIAQQTTTNATSPEAAPEGGAATTGEHQHESTSSSNETQGETFTVRDSVFALLADQTIPSSSFINLNEPPQYSIRNGHKAEKIQCNNNPSPLLTE